jgi:SnoaL-like domain
MKLSGQEYADVMTLYSKFHRTSDLGTPEEYASCLTVDAMVTADGAILYRGRDEILEFKKRDVLSREGHYRRHQHSTIELDKIDSNTIHGRAYGTTFGPGPDGAPVVVYLVVYEHDVIKRENGEWRFAQRTVRRDYVKPGEVRAVRSDYMKK